MATNKLKFKSRIITALLGLVFALVILEGGLRLGGWAFFRLQERRNIISARQRGTYRILCLGESMTALGGENSYPRQLEEILNQRDIGIKFSVINKGMPSVDSGVIMLHLENNLNRYTPDMVIAMMGCTDTGDILPYGNVPVLDKTPFKIYRLARILWYHLLNKTRKEKIHPPPENGGPPSDDLPFPPPPPDLVIPPEEPAGMGPEGYRKYIRLGMRYLDEGKFDRADEMFQKAVELNPESGKAYIVSGWWYRNNEQTEQAAERFKKAIKINPGNDQAYFGLGRCYRDLGKNEEAEEIFKNIIQLHPKNDQAYLKLGWCYWDQGKNEEAEEMFKKTIEINPKNEEAYAVLRRHYKERGEYDKAEVIMKKAIELNPEIDRHYMNLGWLYRDQGKNDRAEEMFKKAIQLNPENGGAYASLAYCYKEWGEPELAEGFSRKANKLRTEYYNPLTSRHYQKLKKTVTERGMKLVCVQYPMLEVEPLKEMLKPYEDIIFVDNEMSFKKALEQSRCDEYFADMFAGDFGHCTPRGNRLLAKNIADSILRECFDRRGQITALRAD